MSDTAQFGAAMICGGLKWITPRVIGASVCVYTFFKLITILPNIVLILLSVGVVVISPWLFLKLSSL